MPEAATTEVTPAPKPVSKTRRKMREKDEQKLGDYLISLNADQPIKVDVVRLLPKSWKGQTIDGKMDTFDEPVSEEEIRDLYGGGKYKLQIYTPNEQGSWEFFTSRQLKLAGDPKVKGLTEGEKTQPEAAPTVMTHAMTMAENMAASESARAERAEQRALEAQNQPSRDDGALQMVMEELREARKESSAKDDRLMEVLTAKPDSSATEMLLGKALEGESARMIALQTRIDSELRQRGDMHRDEVNRLSQRYEDIATRQDAAHVREITSLQQSNENSTTLLRVSYDGQLKALEREIDNLRLAATGNQTELATLRAQKNRSPVETLTELAAMKEAMEAFTGSGEEKGSTIERIIGGVMESPLAQGVAQRLAGGPAAVGAQVPTPEAAEPEIPINRPVSLPDGRVVVRRANGQIMEIRQKQKGHQPSGDATPAITDEDLMAAVQFMESSLDGDTEPETFVRTARNLMPSLTNGPIVELLRAQGIDALLARVAKSKPGSQLLTQHGKNWMRKVGEVLLS